MAEVQLDGSRIHGDFTMDFTQQNGMVFRWDCLGKRQGLIQGEDPEVQKPTRRKI